MDCPLSPARLHELHHGADGGETWSPGQIAVLAAAATGEPVTAADVRAWLDAAGIALRQPPGGAAVKPAPATRPARPARNREARPPGGILRPCEECGREVRRIPSEVMEHVFCSQACCRTWRKTQKTITRVYRRSQAARDLSALKLCPACGETQPLAAYSVDTSRADGRTRICRRCNDQKSRAYYLANAERLKARALERKRSLREAGE